MCHYYRKTDTSLPFKYINTIIKNINGVTKIPKKKMQVWVTMSDNKKYAKLRR